MKKCEDLIDEVIKRKTWLLKENSNTQMSPSLIDLYISSQVNENYALKNLYSPKVVRHHKQGLIYIHTLHSPFKPYCSGSDARIVLRDGLRFPHCNSAPAKHFISAVYQSMAFLFYSQLFFSGAQAMDYYNWFFAPYVRYDNLDYQEVKQILQGFVFQLNQSNRTGAQSAFTNVGMRINCPSYLEDEPVIFAGKKLPETYKNFEKEARLIYKALMEIMGEGTGKGAPFTFPIITTAITKGLDWNDELMDLTLETTSKTGAPYFLNLATDYLSEKYVHAMCCRLLVEHAGGVWMVGGLGTGSNKVVTINLPHIALISKGVKQFFLKLDETMQIARVGLKESNHIIKMGLERFGILPWLNFKTYDGMPYYNFKERRLTFGVVGLNECLLNLINEPLVSKEGGKWGLKIISHMATNIKKFSGQDKIVYTLEQTPAESSSYRLAKQDKKRFGRRAHLQGSGQNVYYTNSTHVPYKGDVSIFDRVKIEAEFHPYFTGGAMSHIWIGESKPSVGSLKNLVKKLSKTRLAYFAFTPDYSICKNEHFSRGKLDKCPKCGAEIKDHMSRIVGYFTRTSNWNPGKAKEYLERKRFEIK